ncbi:CAP domain-containing protein [Brevundimonas sp.]|uniref:CAP domain-containing protein n=1 Tax=Brevundimonas sp. TaxID=1871086 RepID=UPI0035613637
MRRSLILILAGLLPAAAACADGYAPQAARAPLIESASQSARQVVPIVPPRSSRPSDPIESRLLQAHNFERARVDVPPLVWSDELESEARGWAEELIVTGRFAHDPSLHGHGENLWSGWGGHTFTPDDMVGEWIAKKAQYRPGVFPNVSRSGNWTDVGHYTQLVWSGTTHVGCAIAARGDRSVLACRYAPPGNIDGRRAF